MEMTGDQPRGEVNSTAEVGAGEDDQEQFARLFQDCRPYLQKLCERILGESDRASDAVSETYLRACLNRTNFDGVNLTGWLSRIAKHICIDRIRRGFPTESLDAVIGPATTDSEVRTLTGMQIRAILSKLPEQQRRCLKLSYIEGFSAKEVAHTTGWTDKQVKSYLQNGRRNFIRLWKVAEDKGDE
jgi:RNA polymerase sigma-70 factor (ECF subfamily)